MNVKVSLKNLRIAPRKSRQVIDLIRSKKVTDARAILGFTVKRATKPILKLLNSAVATALNDFKLKESDLFIYKVTADEGPTLKRSNPESRGRAFPIMKRTSHITLVLSDGKSEEEKDNKLDVKNKNKLKDEKVSKKITKDTKVKVKNKKIERKAVSKK